MSLQNQNMRLVLASKSDIRAKVLKDAGLAFDIIPSKLDENILKAERQNGEDLARELAIAKAMAVSATNSGALIIGADQIAICEGRLFDKPISMAAARENLMFLSAKRHSLLSGVALVKNGECLWSKTVQAQLTVRELTPDFLDAYFAVAGEAILNSVGCYRLEGVGVQLFEKIEGDHLTIYGMPLLQMLPQLRKLGVVK